LIIRKIFVAFSYFWYPETAIKSKIKKEIFKRTPIHPNLVSDLEKEYFSVINAGRTIKDVIRESWRC